jgi:hypothetical protein
MRTAPGKIRPANISRLELERITVNSRDKSFSGHHPAYAG